MSTSINKITQRGDVKSPLSSFDLKIELDRYPSSSSDGEPRKDKVKKPERKSPASKIQLDDDHTTQNESQSNDDHVADIYSDYGLYLPAKNGSLDEFSQLLDRISAADQTLTGDILRRASPAGNTSSSQWCRSKQLRCWRRRRTRCLKKTRLSKIQFGTGSRSSTRRPKQIPRMPLSPSPLSSLSTAKLSPLPLMPVLVISPLVCVF
ncbi:hypothetical protein PHJA_002435300 [Phtheirospermum japonicum]|uniref:Uncharacterized protein n=1 Tax=Phtheirospermum japonicum TaxID=374723 RepID=A0A830D378_9LAMI|nr:hypothetical protein PHJA_002435300 [Phtheirospermum japonicum]